MGCRRRRVVAPPATRRPARSRPARAIRPLVFLDQLAARSPDRPRDHRTAGVDVLPSLGQNSLYELTDNSALGVATSVAGPKTTTTALTVFSQPRCSSTLQVFGAGAI